MRALADQIKTSANALSSESSFYLAVTASAALEQNFQPSHQPRAKTHNCMSKTQLVIRNESPGFIGCKIFTSRSNLGSSDRNKMLTLSRMVRVAIKEHSRYRIKVFGTVD